jgi:hypothetical protein
MSTTHSQSYGLKLIGTGLEQSTWGASTNQNFKRIQDILGYSVTIDLLSMPGASTSTDATASSAATWILQDAADSDGTSSDDGAEGRCSAVEFTGALSPSSPATVEIRGQTDSAEVNRTLFVWNNTSNSNDIYLECAGGTLTIKNGCFAIVNTCTTTKGGWTAGVNNLLEKLQLENIVLSGTTGEIEFLGDATVTLKANSATGLAITDGTTDFITVDTSTADDRIIFDSANVDGPTLDFAPAGITEATVVHSATGAEAFQFEDTAGNPTVTVDAVAEEVEIGSSGKNYDLRVLGNINIDDAARDINVKDATAAALEVIGEDAKVYLTVNTTGNKEAVEFDQNVLAENVFMNKSGATPGGYILGEDPADHTLPATSFGFRTNSGRMEMKHSGKSWLELMPFNWEEAIANSTQYGVGGPETSLGAFDIGPLRFIFNTAVGNGTTITLGSGTYGTTSTMNSKLYTVFATYAQSATSEPCGARVTNSSAGTFVISGEAINVNYIAIGDSGA